jgi:hypothetical protein
MRCRMTISNTAYVACDVVCSLMLIGVLTLWLRSYYYRDYCWESGARSGWSMDSEKGELVFNRWQSQRDIVSPSSLTWLASPVHPGRELFKGVGYDHGASDIAASGTLVRASAWAIWWPHWLLVVLFAMGSASTSAIVFKKAKRARRRKMGCCSACGYDLRGSAGEVCPECGKFRKPG